MENISEVNQTVIKYLRQEALSKDEAAIMSRLLGSEEGRQLVENFKDKEWVRRHLAQHEGFQDITLWQTVEARLEGREDWRAAKPVLSVVPLAPRQQRWIWGYVAAALLLVMAGGIVLWSHLREVKSGNGQVTQPVAVAVLPGGNKAILTLADGRKVQLDSSSHGLIAAQGNVQISQTANGQLSYDLRQKDQAANAAYNILTTPRAGQFSISLPDGTKVWLNNASTLRYPVAFTGKTREVELTGEAYFEVAAKAGMPFVVKVRHSGVGEDGGAIKVLGTAFNIMAYSDEDEEQTTLVIGRIEFVREGTRRELRPEEQAVVNAQGSLMLLQHVNVDEVTAWKNGYFHFDHSSLQSTMRQLARWYDVGVNYKTTVKGQSFNGKIQRNLPLADVLKGLENSNVHFQLQGHALTVLP